MSREFQTNAALAAGAVSLFTLLAPLSAHTSVNDGLGSAGVPFAHMVSAFTLKGGDEATRLSPLFPALAWAPYALTGNVVASLGIVNRVALGVLVFAACLMLDERRVAARWKVFVAVNLTLAIAFARLVAFVPGRPELCALAALTLAIAVSSSRQASLTAASHVAAVMAMPVGIAAPIYGIVRSTRLAEPPKRIALMYGPALLIWIGVQWWARGGVAGALADASPRALFDAQEVWRDPLFLSVAIYFLVTSAGGLSVIALVQRSAWGQVARRAPEAVALTAVLLISVFMSRTEAPISFGFLAPVWVLVAAEWSRLPGARRGWWWFVAGIVVTFVTQRPFADVDVTAYYVDWHPYDVHRGSAAVAYPQLWEHWVPRFVVAAISLRVMALVAGSGAAKEDTQPLPTEPESRPTTPLAFMPASVARLRHLLRKTIAVRQGERWRILAYAYALLLGAITAFFLFGIPIQLTDSFANLLGVQGISVWDVFRAEMGGHGYLRPLLQVQLKVVYDLAHGSYFAWYRSIQALQVIAALLLTVRILRIRSVRDCAVVPVCLAMVLGLHTFAGAIREAFPINTFLTLVLCCLVAVCLAQSRGGAKIDVASVALLAFSLLTLETGVLVWVIVIAAHLVGYKGVSRRGLVFMTIVLAGYFIVRFAILNVGPPGLNERPSGFGFHTLEPSELVARFGNHPLPLYLYNYVCAMFTVLFAEPRGAVWQFVADLSQRTIEPWYLINVVVSTLTTAVIAWYVARRAPAWRRRDILEQDRLVLLFLAVLPVNAVLCVVYVKDVIMSPAGTLYAIAAFVAMRELLTVMSLSRARVNRVSTVSLALLVALSAGWGWRFVGIEYNLRTRATDVRSEWAFEDAWETSNHIQIDTAEAAALKRTLVDDAIWRRKAPPRLALRWPREFFDTTQ